MMLNALNVWIRDRDTRQVKAERLWHREIGGVVVMGADVLQVWIRDRNTGDVKIV